MKSDERSEVKSGIYKIENLINGKLYIGSAVYIKKRWINHKSDLKKRDHRNTHLQRAYNKYDEKAFLFSVIEFVKNKEDLILKEQYYIDINDFDNLYNICPIAGNSLGRKFSDKSKKKISEAKKGKTHSNETKKKMSKAKKGDKNYWFGKAHSEESKKKISKAHKGKILSDEHKRKMSDAKKGEKHCNFGKTLSEEHKKKISKSMSGKKHSEETKKKMSEAHIGEKSYLFGRRGEKNPFSKMITFQGKTQNIDAWAKEIGIAASGMGYRLKNWPLEKALTEPRRAPRSI